ncbi:DUF3667 domain-containing protein [Sphingobium nicotianae]|uniref:DUF3667 domain-containing protein n=1 Tax=Sphingobium nicotianae TaxID=2782607 RepID=A0A9X1DFS2_9SPHN|nr:DUF3667 domain-containing protein [Sphingobium nicotianae]MBT2189170.1 DUF3667 domain-containing protein [Sphingobium nicotianae]
MTSGLEAAADAATGAVIASAVEPGHGETGHAGHDACLNCGTVLAGPFCQTCGQNSHLHRTIAGFAHDLLHGVFHFEGKIWATLPMLLLRPGELTRRYIAGERAKFVSPLALFLFCTFLMFAVVGSLAGDIGNVHVNAPDRAHARANLDVQLAAQTKKLAAVDAKITDVKKRGQDASDLAKARADIVDEIDGLKTARGLVPAEGSKPERESGQFINGIKTGWATLDHGIQAANENPGLFLYRLQSSAYKYSWLLIPLSTPLVWLLFFWKRQYKFYDHLVFVTFSITFMLLLVTVLSIAGALGAPASVITLAAVFVPPLHAYRQLRGAYGSSRLGTLLRTGLLMAMGLFVLILYLAILLAMGIMH